MGINSFCKMLNYCRLRSGGGISEVLEPADPASPDYAARVIFDLSFFIVIIVILINLIFGVIIDTFSELRDERESILEDIHNYCFICSLERDKLQLLGTSTVSF